MIAAASSRVRCWRICLLVLGSAVAPALSAADAWQHIDRPPDANGSRVPSYRATRAPPYPPDALMAREAGTVKLGVLIAADGNVQTVEVVESSGSAALDAAAQEDVAYWKFHPGMKDGVPVEKRVVIPVDFRFRKRLHPSLDAVFAGQGRPNRSC